jgi:uncharacterized protein (DUF58 family)
MKITREGKRFIVATFLIAFAALNTGNNLIYLILSLMLAIILLSAVLLRSNLSGLSLNVAVTAPLFAGEKVSSRIEIRNSKHLFPTYSVSVRSPVMTGPLYFPFVPRGSGAATEPELLFLNRGIYRFEDFSVASGFPFILFGRSKPIDASGEVIVYPALRNIDNMMEESAGDEGGETTKPAWEGDDIYSLREYRFGDDWRRIHWKASAKASGLLVREYAKHTLKKATILLDNLSASGGGLDRREKVAGPYADEQFEKMVSLTGSLAQYFLERGYFVRVVSCKNVIPFGCGDEHLFKILDILAVVNEEEEWDSPVFTKREGVFVSVLRSRSSSLKGYAVSCDRVIYADTL